MQPASAAHAVYEAIRRRFGREQRPDAVDFEVGPLAAALFIIDRDFEALQRASPHSPVRVVVVPPSGLFPPCVFSVLLLEHADGPKPMIVDLAMDEDYFDTIGDDPSR